MKILFVVLTIMLVGLLPTINANPHWEVNCSIYANGYVMCIETVKEFTNIKYDDEGNIHLSVKTVKIETLYHEGNTEDKTKLITISNTLITTTDGLEIHESNIVRDDGFVDTINGELDVSKTIKHKRNGETLFCKGIC